MQKILDYLEQLGFSKIEANIYWKLLESGPMTVAKLAQTVKLNRTAMYPYIHSLLKRGIIAEIMQYGRKQLVATDPEQLHYIIERKMDSLKAVEAKFPDVLETINTILPQERKAHTAEIAYYQESSNARKIYEEALSSDEFRAYVKIRKTKGLFPDNANIFNTALKKNKKLRIWEIIYDTTSTTIEAQQVHTINPRYQYKFMPTELKLTSEDILLYANKVAIINYKETIKIIVLQNPDFYNNLKELFDFMWNIIP